MVIPPTAMDRDRGSKKHWIICLLTSEGYGRHVSPPDVIVNSTHAALEHLKRQIDKYEEGHREFGEPKPGKLYCCRFNSGLLGVPWERTRKLLEDSGLDMTVVYPPDEDEKEEKQ